MVGTRVVSDDRLATRRFLLSRESRKSSRGALEEPEDEIFWDSDEVKAAVSVINVKNTLNELPAVHAVTSKHSKSETQSSMTKDKRVKGKISPKCQASSSSSINHSHERGPSVSQDDVCSEVPCISPPEGASKNAAVSSKAIPKSNTEVQDLFISPDKNNVERKICRAKQILNKGFKSVGGSPMDENGSNNAGKGKMADRTIGNKNKKVRKAIVDMQRDEKVIPNPDSENGDKVEEDVKMDVQNEEIESKYDKELDEGTSNAHTSQTVNSQGSDEDVVDTSGLRRSSRRSSYLRPTWLVGRRRLRGYPSHVPGKDGKDTLYVDSEELSDEDMLFAVPRDRSRRCRLPRRYQEDTEEEEEISRGPGHPRGNKGTLLRRSSVLRRRRSSSSGGVVGDKTGMVATRKMTRKVTRTKKLSSPRRRRANVLVMTDEEEGEDEHEEEEEEDQEIQKEDKVVRPRMRRRARVAYVDATDTEPECSVETRITRKTCTVSLSKTMPVREQDSDDCCENIKNVEEQQEEDVSPPKQAFSTAGASVRRKRGRPPKVCLANVRDSDKDECKEEEEDDDDDEEVEDSGEDEEPSDKKAGKQKITAAMKDSNQKKLNDPIFRNEDCVKLAKTLNSYNGKKRTRRPVNRFSYSTDAHERSDNKTSSSTTSSSSSSSGEEDEEHGKGYPLRRSNRKQSRQFSRKLVDRSNRHHNRVASYLGSPARKPVNVKRRTTHNKSSTSDISAGSNDERTFDKRRAKSNAKARSQMLPMNFNEEDLQTSIIKDRSKVGSSLADVEPMAVDRQVTFSSVGGLNEHVRSLREMVVLPLLYPEVFAKFGVTPPRGVLFYGPPGTGKTLVARALANECSMGDKKVAFFMRKGADCLSKWVGESERQLRLLFDQAYQMRPSIIFFDEIDGLAPVRSSRQDQIHSSIVSTLLALMDGLDCRGEIIVIGATNRIEAIDPALRRPGRFDRELCFPLPSAKARRQILSVHTSCWQPRPSERLLQYLADSTVGYCGADLKSLCCEAVLACLRTRYPQVYTSDVKLQLDIGAINVRLCHFRAALSRIVPAGQRSRGSIGARLHPYMRPLLQRPMQALLTQIAQVFPQGLTPSVCHRRLSHSSISYRPRLLVQGRPGQGQSSHLGPALVHAMERVPAHRLDLATIYGSTAYRSPEEAVAQILHEACSRPPSIIYMPHLDRWFSSVSDSVRATFLALLADVSPSAPVFLLATTATPLEEVDRQAADLFSSYRGEVFTMYNPSKEERQEFFKPLFYTHMIKHHKPVPRRRPLSPLPVAEVNTAPRQLSEKELQRLVELEEATLRELRIFLRQICAKLARNRQFCIFSQPVDIEDVKDYLDIISQPMDLETMMTKTDRHEYTCAQDFLKDIDLICANALEYNPNHSAEDQLIRHAACALRDTAYTLIKTEMDSDFEDKCQGIRQSRRKRNTKVTHLVPEFVYMQPLPPHNGANTNGQCSSNAASNNSTGAGTSTACANVSSLTIGQGNSTSTSKKKRKSSSWARGCIRNPKKKAHIEKSSDLRDDSADELEDESIRDVDSTSTVDVSVAEKHALDLCNGELSAEDSPDNGASASHIITSPAPSSSAPLQSRRTSSSSASQHQQQHGTGFPSTRRRSSCGAGTSNSSIKPAAAAAQQEQEDVTVSSSERDDPVRGGCSGVVDWSQLDVAYSRCVSATEGAVVCHLQQLHTTLTRLARAHATTRDKTHLLQDVETEIRQFVRHKDHL